MEFQTIGKWLLVAGVLFVMMGGAFLLAGKLGFRGLPGDIRIEREGTSLYFPIVTCVVVSIFLTIILNLMGRR